MLLNEIREMLGSNVPSVVSFSRQPYEIVHSTPKHIYDLLMIVYVSVKIITRFLVYCIPKFKFASIFGKCNFVKFRDTHRRYFVRKGILRNFGKFTGTYLCQNHFFR